MARQIRISIPEEGHGQWRIELPMDLTDAEFDLAMAIIDTWRTQRRSPTEPR